MILGRLFLLIQTITILLPGHQYGCCVVTANPLKRLFMMRRMKNGDDESSSSRAHTKDRTVPKGAVGEETDKKQSNRMRNIPEQVHDYLGNDIYAQYRTRKVEPPSNAPITNIDHQPESTIETRTRLEESKEAEVPSSVEKPSHSKDPIETVRQVEDSYTNGADAMTAERAAGETKEEEPITAVVEEPLVAPTPPTAEDASKHDSVSLDTATTVDNAVCIHPQQLEAVQEELQDAKLGQSKLQKQHELYRQESESRLMNLTKANESAYKIARVQEEFAERIVKMQNTMEANLEAAKVAIAAKEEELETLKQEMKEKEVRMKQEMEEKIDQAKKDWKKQLSDAQADLNAGNEKIRAEYESRLKQAEEDKAILKGEKKLMAENYEKLETKYENMLRDQEIALKAYLEVNLENEANKKKEAFRDTLIADLESIKTSSEATISQLTSDLETLNTTSTAAIQELRSKYEALKETSEKKIEQLTSDYAELQKSSQEKIEEITRNAENALAELRKQSADELEKALASLESNHSTAMSKLSEQISTLQSERKGLASTIKTNAVKLKTTEEKYEQAARDAEYWEEKFEHRSYVNLTHITLDASEYASVVAAPVAKSTRNVYEAHVAPTAEKSKQLYDRHLRSTIDKAANVAAPVYKNHVEPHLESAKLKVSETGKSVFDTIKTKYEVACPSAMASLRDMEKATGMLLPDSVVESTRYSCQHADESVSAFLKVMAVVLAVVFRRSLWRLLLGTIAVTLRGAYRITVAPWKMMFGEKIKKESPGGGYASGTGGTPPKKPKTWKLM